MLEKNIAECHYNATPYNAIFRCNAISFNAHLLYIPLKFNFNVMLLTYNAMHLV